jgi:hypothetical protein
LAESSSQLLSERHDLWVTQVHVVAASKPTILLTLTVVHPAIVGIPDFLPLLLATDTFRDVVAVGNEFLQGGNRCRSFLVFTG